MALSPDPIRKGYIKIAIVVGISLILLALSLSIWGIIFEYECKPLINEYKEWEKTRCFFKDFLNSENCTRDSLLVIFCTEDYHCDKECLDFEFIKMNRFFNNFRCFYNKKTHDLELDDKRPEYKNKLDVMILLLLFIFIIWFLLLCLSIQVTIRRINLEEVLILRMKNLEKYVYQNEEEIECGFCLDNLNNTEIYELLCTHKYHVECWQIFLEKGTNIDRCPQCSELLNV